MYGFPIEVLLFALLIAIAVVISRTRDLFAAAMLFGIFSLLSAGLFTLLDAVDVAFTEAAIGAGVSTILILSALSLTSETERPCARSALARLARGLPIVLTGAALVYGTLDMPHYGDPGAPIHNHVAPYYIEQGPIQTGLPNFVTSILASYRGFDTYGESMVIFTAAIGVILILSGARKRDREESDA